MKKIILNQNGHGYSISGKDALKILGILITFPISIPVIIIKAKIDKKKEKKG